jgi:tetratricopeptide (TPR) repeat protein
MNPVKTLWALLLALFILSFSLAASLQPRFQAIEYANRQNDNFFSLLLGDSSRIFANNFFIKADAYYHSGYYPTIFDNKQAFETPHIAEDTGAVASHNSGEETSFMGAPRDWVDAFGRHFIPNRHTHLDEGGPTDDLSKSTQVREILPWLKLSSKLDPENIKTYLVMAYWLRSKLNQASEAEMVLREGLRSNPGNAQLLFELGRIYDDDYHNPNEARTIWEAALRSWMEEQPGVPLAQRLAANDTNFDDRFLFEQINEHLAAVEEKAGNDGVAIAHLQLAQQASPKPEDLQQQIDDLKKKMAGH